MTTQDESESKNYKVCDQNNYQGLPTNSINRRMYSWEILSIRAIF